MSQAIGTRRPRGSRPDGETSDALVLIKRVSALRATYQVRLLLYMAVRDRRRLMVIIPPDCKLHDDLADLAAKVGGVLQFVRK